MAETTALGAAIAAGCAEGIKIWDLNKVQPTPSDEFHPLVSDNGKREGNWRFDLRYSVVCRLHNDGLYVTERDVRYYKWKMAVSKSLDWEIRSELTTNNCAGN